MWRYWFRRSGYLCGAQTPPDTRLPDSGHAQTSTVEVPTSVGAATVPNGCDGEARLQGALASLDATMSSTSAASMAASAAAQIGVQP